MTTVTDLEKRLLALDMELHSILDMVKEQKIKELRKDVVEDSAGAWGYDVDKMRFFVDTSIFVDCLRKDVVLASKSFIKSLLDANTGYTSTITVAELSVGALFRALHLYR